MCLHVFASACVCAFRVRDAVIAAAVIFGYFEPNRSIGSGSAVWKHAIARMLFECHFRIGLLLHTHGVGSDLDEYHTASKTKKWSIGHPMASS